MFDATGEGKPGVNIDLEALRVRGGVAGGLAERTGEQGHRMPSDAAHESHSCLHKKQVKQIEKVTSTTLYQ